MFNVRVQNVLNSLPEGRGAAAERYELQVIKGMQSLVAKWIPLITTKRGRLPSQDPVHQAKEIANDLAWADIGLKVFDPPFKIDQRFATAVSNIATLHATPRLSQALPEQLRDSEALETVAIGYTGIHAAILGPLAFKRRRQERNFDRALSAVEKTILTPVGQYYAA